ncbi:MAG: hypothetical protein CMJ18_12225 [Phycisphaeraceae bacterium]|nr:hypothetical protein [Phycisphaeraceae bacterium]
MPVYFESLEPAARSAIGPRGQFVMAAAPVSATSLLACCRDRSHEVSLWLSHDEGLTWSTFRTHGDRLIGNDRAVLHACRDGDMLLDIGRLYRSSDQGITWSLRSRPRRGGVARIVDGPDDRITLVGSGESWYSGLGRLSGVEPDRFLQDDETDPHLLVLRDGRLLCTFARHDVPIGILAVISEDAGTTWDTDHPVCLAGSWPNMFGCPTSIELSDGSILTTHSIRAYRETDKIGDSVAHAVRWRLPGDKGASVVPAHFPALSDRPDWQKYDWAGTGFTGDLQQIAYWEKSECERVRVDDHYKGALGRLPDGELLISPMRDETLDIYRSTDDGRSWDRVVTCGANLRGKEQAMLCLEDDDTVLLTAQLTGVPKGDNESALFRSADRGRTWEEIDFGEGSTSYRRDLVRLSDGSVALFNSRGDNRESEGAPATTAWRMRSVDGGRTWQRDPVRGAWPRSRPFFTEAAFLRLSEGRLLMAARINGDHVHAITGIEPPAGLGWHNAEINQAMAFMESADDGLSWSEPWVALDYSDVHAKMLRLDDGRILCSYRCRSRLPFGTRAVFSEDDGRTWDLKHPILLGAHSTYYGGWQTDLQLSDGTMMTTWAWAFDGPYTFEVIRWRLPRREGAGSGERGARSET